AHFSAIVGVGGCPASTPPQTICPNPQYTLAGAGGAYSLTLSAGKWGTAGFYELAGFGGQFIGANSTVTVTAGKVTHQNYSVAYKAPGTVRGTVTITGVPKGVTVESQTVVACPANDPDTGGTVPIVCVTGGTANYSLTTLPPGPWLLYPGYSTIYGSITSKSGLPVTVVSGKSVTKDLTFAYQKPTEGLVDGTVTVTGAPPGFNGYTGAIACKGTAAPDCPMPTSSYQVGNPSQLLLSAGTWSITGDYQLNFDGGTFTGPDVNVKVVAGVTSKVNLFVHYVAPGALIGLVTVTGIPSGTHIEDAIVLACPAADPYVPPASPGPMCAEAGTPLEADYSLTTLPPGSWLLYPGYAAYPSYSLSLSSKGIAVTVTSKAVTIRNLTVAYQG
ncbi:MAG: hypothetical protein ABSC41_14190, partial [Acidimicrobiales bacterium]